MTPSRLWPWPVRPARHRIRRDTGSDETPVDWSGTSFLRPGLGSHAPSWLDALPVQPQYESLEMTIAELLDVIKLSNVQTVFSQHMQQSEDSSYEIQFPKKLSEERVEQHVREMFMDDDEALKTLSVDHDDPSAKLERAMAYRQPGRRSRSRSRSRRGSTSQSRSNSNNFYGYELRVEVTKGR